MFNILVSGANGRMGRVVCSLCRSFDKIDLVIGIDKNTDANDFVIYKSFSDVEERVDVIIDFSHPSNLQTVLSYALKHNVPAVICTTGFSEEDNNKILEASSHVPIFFSANMSLGINIICNLVSKIAAVLYDDFDIEIIEKHHNEKLDAPSGTAYMIAEKIKSGIDKPFDYVCGRESKTTRRGKKEMGIHSVRGGNVVGEHSVLFLGQDEILEVKHTASSKGVFAIGAIRAALFLINKKPGLYSMEDLINSSVAD